MIIVTIITFIVILTVLVFFHELGHFWTARKFGVKVREFGLGLPPRLIGVRRKGKQWEVIKGGQSKAQETRETIYSLNWLPIGGFVNIGEDDGDVADKTSFQSKSPGRRALILSAGVIMNTLLTAVLLSIVFMIGTPQIVDPASQDLSRHKDLNIVVNHVVAESPADVGGLKAGDIITQVDARRLTDIEELRGYISVRPNEFMQFQILRQGEPLRFILAPDNLEGIEGAAIGVGLVNTATLQLPVHEALWQGVLSTGRLIGAIVRALGDIIGDLVSQGRVEQDFAGPVGIAVLTGQAVELGLARVLEFAALLSINLAIINILPFPALDGGRILFIAIEKLRGKPVAQKIEGITHTIGFALLIALILLVTYKDITRFGASILKAIF